MHTVPWNRARERPQFFWLASIQPVVRATGVLATEKVLLSTAPFPVTHQGDEYTADGRLLDPGEETSSSRTLKRNLFTGVIADQDWAMRTRFQEEWTIQGSVFRSYRCANTADRAALRHFGLGVSMKDEARDGRILYMTFSDPLTGLGDTNVRLISKSVQRDYNETDSFADEDSLTFTQRWGYKDG